jgi:hypothetical protein
MASPNVIPWYNRPARPFPALVWLGQHYPFVVSPLVVARLAPRPPCSSAPQRPFPALVWVARQHYRLKRVWPPEDHLLGAARRL